MMLMNLMNIHNRLSEKQTNITKRKTKNKKQNNTKQYIQQINNQTKNI